MSECMMKHISLTNVTIISKVGTGYSMLREKETEGLLLKLIT